MEKQNPLNILLKFLDNKKLEISDLSLAKVADDYLNYLDNFKNQEEIIENISEFLWVASKLALLKSRIVLNIDLSLTGDSLDEDSEELKNRLIEYKKMKEVSFKIKDCLGMDKFLFTRKNKEIIEKDVVLNFKKNKLRDFFEEIIRGLKKEKRIFYQNKKIKETIKVEDRIKQIKLILKKTKKFNFFKLICKNTNKLEITVSFLSILELVKQGRIEIKQNKNFEEIEVIKIKQ